MTCSKVILLVDDEIIIRKTGKRILGKLGYDVILASCGEDALNVYRKEQEVVSLVVLDMIMPGISGKETFDKLQAINPAVKVLLTSGYGDGEDSIEEMIQAGAVGFVQKPYEVDILDHQISTVLV